MRRTYFLTNIGNRTQTKLSLKDPELKACFSVQCSGTNSNTDPQQNGKDQIMINFCKSSASFFFKQNKTDTQQSDQLLSTVKTHRKEIKGVVVDSFLRYLGRNSERLSPEELKTIRSRVTSNLISKRHYPIPCQSQTPTNENILSWFVQGDNGAKLYRRAIVKQDKEVEAFLRNLHVDVNRADKKTGDTPLILAARAHNAEQVGLLLKSGATVDSRNNKGKDAIYEAVTNLNRISYRDDNQFYTINHLLKSGADVNQPLLMGETPQKTLSESAIAKSELRVARLLINHTHELSPCTLFELVSKTDKDNPRIIDHLLDTFDFDLEDRNENGLTPLMVAACQKRPKAMKVLLDQPNNALEAQVILPVDQFLKYWTAYSLADHHQSNECVKLLLRYGARKIVPKLTESEAQWMMKYNELRESHAKTEATLDNFIVKLVSPVHMGGYLFSHMHYSGQFERLENERPEQQLQTPPED